MHCRGLQFVSQLLQISSTKLLRRNLSASMVCCKKTFSRPSMKFSKFKQNSVETNDDVEATENSPESSDEDFRQFVDRTFRISDMGHQVYVIQPYIKWGNAKKRNTSPELQLAESCTLVKTLSDWSVVGQKTVSLMTFDKTTVFGKGNLELLEEEIVGNAGISAVFISVDILKVVQREFLEKLFRVPVYDRYNIVIQIFREHAVSREAKLQVKLAELPYLRGQIKPTSDQGFRGRSGETYVEFHRSLLREQEKVIHREIETLRTHRKLLRKKRQKSLIPVIAVVGYTNCGKTSLIKALTQEDSIMPKNVLFATLDVTAHAGHLPSAMKCVYVDTIGFISDIPTTLLESFVATLEDALLADVIVHVRDVSHPDAQAQNDHVNETLQSLNLSEDLMQNIITVGNKIDLVEDFDETQYPETIFTSAIKLKGLDELKNSIEEAILRVGGRQKLTIRVRTGGEEYRWLRREATVCQVLADPSNEEYSHVTVIITPPVLAKFTHQFISSHRNR